MLVPHHTHVSPSKVAWDRRGWETGPMSVEQMLAGLQCRFFKNISLQPGNFEHCLHDWSSFSFQVLTEVKTALPYSMQEALWKFYYQSKLLK